MQAAMDEDPILPIVAQIIRRMFHCAADTRITRETTALDIDGWDSLSHTSLVLEIEERFDIELSAERMFDLADVGELADLIAEAQGEHG